MTNLTPAVGYMGGKRRIAKRIVSMLPKNPSVYIEPFVGMGAVYLQLRKEGYRGPAILADAHPCVAEFWRILHSSEAQNLVEACRALHAVQTSAEFYAIAKMPAPSSRIERVAMFLWIVNYSFGNRPPGIEGDKWILQGCKVGNDKAAPGAWEKVTQRISLVVGQVKLWDRVVILQEAIEAIGRSEISGAIYADPPYYGTSEYQNKCKAMMAALDAAPGAVLLSEMSTFPCIWPSEPVKLVARLSQGKGASGDREERIFIKPRSLP